MVLKSVVSWSSVSLSCSKSVKRLMSISLNFLKYRWILCRFNEGRVNSWKRIQWWSDKRFVRIVTSRMRHSSNDASGMPWCDKWELVLFLVMIRFSVWPIFESGRLFDWQKLSHIWLWRVVDMHVEVIQLAEDGGGRLWSIQKWTSPVPSTMRACSNVEKWSLSSFINYSLRNDRKITAKLRPRLSLHLGMLNKEYNLEAWRVHWPSV